RPDPRRVPRRGRAAPPAVPGRGEPGRVRLPASAGPRTANRAGPRLRAAARRRAPADRLRAGPCRRKPDPRDRGGVVTQARYQTAADLLHGWRDDVLSGRPPILYPVGAGELARLEIGPGLVTLVGGAAGAGKTAFTMQLLLDALRLTPALKAVVCNIEMAPAVLLDRQLARLSGVPLTEIRHRRLTEAHADRIDQGLHTLDALSERLAFV